jgi:hypothetical protein
MFMVLLCSFLLKDVGHTCKSAFERFEEERPKDYESSLILLLSLKFKPLSSAIAKEGFSSF